ncbi:MAG: hypothetical protein PHN75_12230 [Syntrophales bacterium]|nr:hypothetical protein [Syntrophales bacterium]
MLKLIKKTGRVAETRLALMFNLKSGQYFKDADLGRRMIFKGKLSPFTTSVNKIDEVRRIFELTAAKKEDRE